MSDTPRTDYKTLISGDYLDGTRPFVSVEFARTLEREINALTAEIALLRGLIDKSPADL